MDKKRCTKCKKLKVLIEFYKSNNRDGLRNDCNVCFKEYIKAYRKRPEGKEQEKKYRRTYTANLLKTNSKQYDKQIDSWAKYLSKHNGPAEYPDYLSEIQDE